MIVPVIALGLFALSVDVEPPPSTQEPFLTIDPCVEVDETTVREVMDLELAAVHGADETQPAAVLVRCVPDGQEIRIEPWASSEPGAARTIRLTSAEGTLPVARAARSRELALAIAEIIRRRATAPARVPETLTPVAPPVSAIPTSNRESPKNWSQPRNSMKSCGCAEPGPGTGREVALKPAQRRANGGKNHQFGRFHSATLSSLVSGA